MQIFSQDEPSLHQRVLVELTDLALNDEADNFSRFYADRWCETYERERRAEELTVNMFSRLPADIELPATIEYIGRWKSLGKR